jgi:hypothetical protein
MAKQRIHIELLLGRKVRDVNGHPAGRIEEILCTNKDATCTVTHFLLGRGGLMDRLSIPALSTTLLGLLGNTPRHPTHKVHFSDLDLSNPKHPRLKIPADQMKELAIDD